MLGATLRRFWDLGPGTVHPLPRRWRATALLLVLTGLATWWLHVLDYGPPVATGPPPHVADLFMRNFTSTTMNAQGEPLRRLQAKDLRHFGDTQTSDLTAPYLVLYRNDGPPWHVRSARGWISANGDVTLLLGPVHIWRDDRQGQRVADIHTTDLRVLPQTGFGETNRPVTITTPTTTSTGLGLRAYLHEDRLELLSQVHTTYEPRAH